MVLVVKNPPANAGDIRNSIRGFSVGDIRDSTPGSGRSLEEGMVTHSSILAWRIPWTEEPGRLQSIRLQRVRYDWSDLARTRKVLSSYNNYASTPRHVFSLVRSSSSPSTPHLLSLSTRLIQQKPNTLCPVKALSHCVPLVTPLCLLLRLSNHPAGLPTPRSSPACPHQHTLCSPHPVSPCIMYTLHHGSYSHHVPTTYHYPACNQRVARPMLQMRSWPAQQVTGASSRARHSLQSLPDSVLPQTLPTHSRFSVFLYSRLKQEIYDTFFPSLNPWEYNVSLLSPLPFYLVWVGRLCKRALPVLGLSHVPQAAPASAFTRGHRVSLENRNNSTCHCLSITVCRAVRSVLFLFILKNAMKHVTYAHFT